MATSIKEYLDETGSSLETFLEEFREVHRELVNYLANNTVTVEEFIVERNGRYRGYHTIYVIEINDKFYGMSEVNEGFQTFTTCYGTEMATSSNFQDREDGFDTPEEAAEQLIRQFKITGVNRKGYAIFNN